MASSALSGANLLDDDITAEDRLAGDAEASHGSLLDDEREADIGLLYKRNGKGTFFPFRRQCCSKKSFTFQ